MSTKQILILQGGGAFGAYECGVYQALAPHLDDLAVVAGTSIGAINASMIAKHYHEKDRGARTLQRFWKEVLATPSFPFFPFPGVFQHWNAYWTSMLFGNPHMFTPLITATSFVSSRPTEQTLTRHFGSYGPDQVEPRLIVTTVDIQAGKLIAFDSFEEQITPHHVVASGSLPPGYPAKEHEGKFYWDGGLWGNTPLPEVLNALQSSSADENWPEYQVYIVDLFPAQAMVPQNSLEVSLRMSEIVFADKTTYDTKSAEWVNRYLTLVRDLEDQKHELPPELQKRLDREHECFPDLPKRAVLHFTHIQRLALPYDAISGGSDFSPQRIEQLMAQGYTDAKSELKAKTKVEARAKVLATRSVSEATRLKQVYSAASDNRLA